MGRNGQKNVAQKSKVDTGDFCRDLSRMEHWMAWTPGNGHDFGLRTRCRKRNKETRDLGRDPSTRDSSRPDL